MNNAIKLYQQGLHKFAQGDFQSGINDLVLSSKKNYKPAIKEIGLCYLHGIALKQDLSKAIDYFKKSKDNPESQYELSKLYYFGHGLKQNYKKSEKYLIKSVKQNYCPAINLMAMAYQVANKIKKSQKLFSHNLDLQDGFALHLNAKILLTKKTKSLKFISKFNWLVKFANHPKISLNTKPEVFEIQNLLSAIECEYIKFISSPYMRESMTIDPVTAAHVKDDIRTSFSATIDWLTEDPVVNLIMSKCTEQFAVEENQSEVLHVLHYSIGEEYKPHYDFFGGIAERENFDKTKQRIKTICLYLNNVKEGGETSFPRLGRIVTPELGKGVFFENINLHNDEPYFESLHAGLPVNQGEKWLATLWIRPINTNRGPNYE